MPDREHVALDRRGDAVNGIASQQRHPARGRFTMRLSTAVVMP
jgi:hypothetical protein